MENGMWIWLKKEMKDNLDNYLVVGDRVHYVINNTIGIGFGHIVGATKCRIIIAPITPVLSHSTVTRDPKKVVRIVCA